MNVRQLPNNVEVHGYMKPGWALTVVREATGAVHRRVPPRAKPAGPGDLTRFIGKVVRNDVSNHLLHLEVQAMNSDSMPTGPALQAVVPYAYMRTLLVLSAYSYDPTPTDPRRPTKNKGLNSGSRPYRTRTKVELV